METTELAASAVISNNRQESAAVDGEHSRHYTPRHWLERIITREGVLLTKAHLERLHGVSAPETYESASYEQQPAALRKENIRLSEEVGRLVVELVSLDQIHGSIRSIQSVLCGLG